jgi:hypothetical protein
VPKTSDGDVVICVGRETIEALGTGEPVKVGDGEYLLGADSYDYPYRRIAQLEAALLSVVGDIEEYERVNNLSPSPGKPDCWQSVTNAKAVLRNSESR